MTSSNRFTVSYRSSQIKQDTSIYLGLKMSTLTITVLRVQTREPVPQRQSSAFENT